MTTYWPSSPLTEPPSQAPPMLPAVNTMLNITFDTLFFFSYSLGDHPTMSDILNLQVHRHDASCGWAVRSDGHVVLLTWPGIVILSENDDASNGNILWMPSKGIAYGDCLLCGTWISKWRFYLWLTYEYSVCLYLAWIPLSLIVNVRLIGSRTELALVPHPVNSYDYQVSGYTWSSAITGSPADTAKYIQYALHSIFKDKTAGVRPYQIRKAKANGIPIVTVHGYVQHANWNGSKKLIMGATKSKGPVVKEGQR